MIVVKFGGSSLADAERMLAAARIVARHQRCESVICVVSAMRGVTDQLLAIAGLARRHDIGWRALYTNLRQRHEQTLAALAPADGLAPLWSLAELWTAVEADILTLTPADDEAAAVFSAWGERLSVRLFAAALIRIGIEPARFEDAAVIVARRDVCRNASASTCAVASVAATRAWLREPVLHFMRWEQMPVVPGYLALTEDGQYTTLGRNASDHSAAIIGAALDASAVYLYSDVAGIYDADPRLSPQATLLPALTYDEAATFLASGARVVHPASLSPLAQRDIPLRLRSALDPDAPGTDIGWRCSPVSRAARELPAFESALLASGCGTERVKAGRRDAF